MRYRLKLWIAKRRLERARRIYKRDGGLVALAAFARASTAHYFARFPESERESA